MMINMIAGMKNWCGKMKASKNNDCCNTTIEEVKQENTSDETKKHNVEQIEVSDKA